MTYPAWRRLPADVRGAIATCDDCRFTRRVIRTCPAHTAPTGCIHPGVFARTDAPTHYCGTCGMNVPTHLL